MIATRFSIAEQVLLRKYGRPVKSSDPVQMPDAMLAVTQACNYLLKGQMFETLKSGEFNPENLMIATYPKQPLVTYGGKRSICTLPAIPVSLPKNMGVWMVSTDEYFECCGIPLLSGQWGLLQGQDMISNLLGQWGFEIVGNKIITTKDLTIDGTDGLYFQLLVTDINLLDDYAPLPIPANMEMDLVNMVYGELFQIEQPIRKVDNYLSSQTQTVKA